VRYKQDVADLEIDPVTVLKMRPRVWRDKSDVEKLGHEEAPVYVGFVAEELHTAGLTAFVGYNEQGEPKSVNYDRLTVALLILARVQQTRFADMVDLVSSAETKATEQQTQIDNLTTGLTAAETKATEQQAQISTLTARLDALAPTPPIA